MNKRKCIHDENISIFDDTRIVTTRALYKIVSLLNHLFNLICLFLFLFTISILQHCRYYNSVATWSYFWTLTVKLPGDGMRWLWLTDCLCLLFYTTWIAADCQFLSCSVSSKSSDTMFDKVLNYSLSNWLSFEIFKINFILMLHLAYLHHKQWSERLPDAYPILILFPKTFKYSYYLIEINTCIWLLLFSP